MGAAASLTTAREFGPTDFLSWRFSPHITELLATYRHHNYDYGIDQPHLTELLKDTFSLQKQQEWKQSEEENNGNAQNDNSGGENVQEQNPANSNSTNSSSNKLIASSMSSSAQKPPPPAAAAVDARRASLIEAAPDAVRNSTRMKGIVHSRSNNNSTKTANKNNAVLPSLDLDAGAIWDAFDRKRSGLILFLDLLVGAAALSRGASVRAKAGFVFDLLDFDQKGWLDWDTSVVLVSTALCGVWSALRAVRAHAHPLGMLLAPPPPRGGSGSGSDAGSAGTSDTGSLPLASGPPPEEVCEFLVESAMECAANKKPEEEEEEVDEEGGYGMDSGGEEETHGYGYVEDGYGYGEHGQQQQEEEEEDRLYRAGFVEWMVEQAQAAGRKEKGAEAAKEAAKGQRQQAKKGGGGAEGVDGDVQAALKQTLFPLLAGVVRAVRAGEREAEAQAKARRVREAAFRAKQLKSKMQVQSGSSSGSIAGKDESNDGSSSSNQAKGSLAAVIAKPAVRESVTR